MLFVRSEIIIILHSVYYIYTLSLSQCYKTNLQGCFVINFWVSSFRSCWYSHNVRVTFYPPCDADQRLRPHID